MKCTRRNKGKGQQKNRISSSNIKDETDMFTKDMHIFKKINSCIRKCKQSTSGITDNTDDGKK
jgi:hypothetical protein